MARLWAFAAMALLCGQAAAQDEFLARWQRLKDAQPYGVALKIASPKLEFYAGESIPLRLDFTASPADTFLADTMIDDRIGRMNYAEAFVIDPATSVEDPLAGLLQATGGMGGLSSGPKILSETPFSFGRTLNEWVRFRTAGSYRMYVLSRRVGLMTEPARKEEYLRFQMRPKAVEVVSNVLTIEIRAAPREWVTRRVTEASRVLAEAAEPTEAAARARMEAIATLRYLDTPEAAVTLAEHLGGNGYDFFSLQMGLLASRHRDQLLPMLERALAAPDRAISAQFLDAAAQLAVRVAMPAPATAEAAQQAFAMQERKREEYTARLLAALPAKQPKERLACVEALFDSVMQVGKRPPWLPTVTAELTAHFRELPPMTQYSLIEGRWDVLRSPAMVPVLREMFLKPPRDMGPWGTESVIRRLLDLAPADARSLLIAEIRKPSGRVSYPALGMLPDRSLPELDEEFATRMEAGDALDMTILRYATGTIVERVERAYVQREERYGNGKLPQCPGPLVYYFLKYDPAFGERELRRGLTITDGHPSCLDVSFQFRSMGAYAMSPALEHLAIEYLASPAVPIKNGFAEILGKYGSPAAEEPLWRTLQYFRSWWKGREEELKGPVGEEGRKFEMTLIGALAQAQAWKLDESGFERLAGLCSSDWCRSQAGHWREEARRGR